MYCTARRRRRRSPAAHVRHSSRRPAAGTDRHHHHHHRTLARRVPFILQGLFIRRRAVKSEHPHTHTHRALRIYLWRPLPPVSYYTHHSTCAWNRKYIAQTRFCRLLHIYIIYTLYRRRRFLTRSKTAPAFRHRSTYGRGTSWISPGTHFNDRLTFILIQRSLGIK